MKFFVWLCLNLAILILAFTQGEDKAQCKDTDYVGAGKPWEYRHGGDFRISENRGYFVMGPAYEITCCGYVTEWEFQASIRAQIRPIEFQIWRPVVGENSTFSLQNVHQYWFTRERSRTVTVKLQQQEYMLVLPGDVIGWHTPLGDVIDYKRVSSVSLSKYSISAYDTSFAIGQKFTLRGQMQRGRQYGIKAVLMSEQPPKFTNLPRKVAFKCPVKLNHHIITITAEPSKGRSTVMYSIDGYSPWFAINSSTGEVRTLKAFAGNLTGDITITATTTTCGGSTSSELILQCIDVGDQNEGVESERDKNPGKNFPDRKTQPSPLPNKPAHHVTFQESVTAETVLYVINASLPNQAGVICTLSSTKPNISSNVLYTSANSLLIKSHYDLLYNTTRLVYVLMICIHDGLTTEEQIVIHVIKDLEPVFVNLPALTHVSARNHLPENVIYKVSASDKENQMLTFDMINCSCPFSLHKDGSVTIARDLRQEITSSLILQIFVSDGFNKVGPMSLNILITDPNHPPQFINLPHEVVVPEHSRGIILTIQSHDPDTQDNVTVRWAWNRMEAVQYFTFNESTKQLSVKSDIQLDYETLSGKDNQTSFTLFLELSDGALLSETEKVTVHVTDVNERPRFLVERINVSCKEGKAGTVIFDSQLRMAATDPDINDALRFYILSGNLSNMFTLNSISGQMRYSLDYDTDPSRLPDHVTLWIQVSDAANLSDVVSVGITIENVNEVPVVMAPGSVEIPEDTPGGTLLFKASAADWDTNDEIKMDFTCIDYSDRFFSFENSGQVRLKENSSLDYEKTPMLTFRVAADDGHVTSKPVFVVLYLLNVNESPTCTKQSIFIKTEGGKKGDVVSRKYLGDIFIDPDDDLMNFVLVQGNESDWSLFDIDSQSGWLYLSHDLNLTRELSPLVYSIYVKAEDPGGLSAKVKIEISVTFVNTKPTLLGLPAHISVLEHFPKDDVIFKVRFEDVDGDDVVLNYCVEGDKIGKSFMYINISTGDVKFHTQPSLSQGETEDISFIITGFDGYLTSDTGILNISIIGVNDSPRFLRHFYKFDINETEMGTPLVRPEMWFDLDPDPSDKLTFIITEGNDYGQISLNKTTGEFMIKKNYDIDLPGNVDNLTFVLMVMDPHGLNDTTLITIKIEDVNDNIPVVENDGDTFFLESEGFAGVKVDQIKASDLDSGKNGALTFSLIGSNLNDTSDFFFVTRDGWIVSTGKIPEQKIITLFVAVSDNGWPSNVAMATVTVMITKSANETALASYRKKNSVGDQKKSGPAILILISLFTCSFAVIMVLSFKLWKAKKAQRSPQPSEDHNAFHEYRFQWVPRQIVEEGGETDTRTSRSSLNAVPSFFGTSVSNQNFHYEPAVRTQNTCSDFAIESYDLMKPNVRIPESFSDPAMRLCEQNKSSLTEVCNQNRPFSANVRPISADCFENGSADTGHSKQQQGYFHHHGNITAELPLENLLHPKMSNDTGCEDHDNSNKLKIDQPHRGTMKDSKFHMERSNNDLRSFIQPQKSLPISSLSASKEVDRNNQQKSLIHLSDSDVHDEVEVAWGGADQDADFCSEEEDKSHKYTLEAEMHHYEEGQGNQWVSNQALKDQECSCNIYNQSFKSSTVDLTKNRNHCDLNGDLGTVPGQTTMSCEEASTLF